MSSDDRGDQGSWQVPIPPAWDQSSVQVPPADPVEQSSYASPPPLQAVSAPVPDGDPAFAPVQEPEEPVADNETDDLVDAGSTPADLLKKFLHYGTLIVLPLLFGAIMCVAVLPRITSGAAYLQFIWSWPIAVLFVAIALGQGFTVYCLRAYTNFWLLGTLGGLFGFLLVGCFALFGPLWSVLLLVVLFLVTLFIGRRSLCKINAGSVGIVFASGKYRRTITPGLSLLLPWEEVVSQLSIEEVHWNCPPQKVQLSRTEDVLLRALISYQIAAEDAYLAITQVHDWQESLRELFTTLLQDTATLFNPNDFLTWPQSLHSYQAEQLASSASGGPRVLDDDFTGGPARREHINTYLFQRMRDRVASWGIQVNWVSIRDIELVPHDMPVQSKPLTDTDPIAPVSVSAPSQVADEPTRQISQEEIPTVALAVPAAAPAKVQEAAPKQVESRAPVSLPSEDILKRAYREVQDGKVTDPQAIRDIAVTFEAVARDPEASKTVDFDAERAARNLYEQARKYEELYSSNTLYSDETRPDWATPNHPART